jgi:3-deoxy-manno-octulosonate cytidylyltransferase (CMP-KDO synthetase)
VPDSREMPKDVLAVIPARYASRRLPGKPLCLLRGRPLVLHAWDAARAAGIPRVVVATDDERVARVVRGAGGEAMMTSPDHPSGTDRVAEVARASREAVILNLQGDEPGADPEVLRALCAAAAAGDPMVTAAAPLTDLSLLSNPHVVKVVCDAQGRALYFSRAAIPAAHPGLAEPPVAYGHLGMYAFRRETLERFVSLAPGRLERIEGLEQLRALEHGIPIRVLRAQRFTRGVDTPEDLEELERNHP